MEKEKKVLYDIGLGVVGALWVGVVTALVYSQLRMGELEALRGELGGTLSSDRQSEYDLLQGVRTVTAAGSMILTSAVVVLSFSYFQRVTEPREEMKKGLLSGIVIFPIGVLMYFSAPDLVSESIGITLVFLGVLTVLVDALLFLQLDPPESSPQ